MADDPLNQPKKMGKSEERDKQTVIHQDYADVIDLPKFIAENIDEYVDDMPVYNIFTNSMGYCGAMTWHDQKRILTGSHSEIRPAIKKALKFISKYDFGYEQANVRIYAIACLPFILAKFKLRNPDIEDREYRKKTLEWLYYIRDNKRMADFHIHSITTNKYKKYMPITFDDYKGFDMEKLNTYIATHEWYLSGKESKKKENWSNVIQFEYLAHSVDIGLKCKTKKTESEKIEFLEYFFLEFGKEVNSLTIKKQMLIASRKNTRICFSKEHRAKILQQPNNKFTKEELDRMTLNPLHKQLL